VAPSPAVVHPQQFTERQDNSIASPHLGVAESHEKPALEDEEDQHQRKPHPSLFAILVGFQKEGGEDSQELETRRRPAVLLGGI